MPVSSFAKLPMLRRLWWAPALATLVLGTSTAHAWREIPLEESRTVAAQPRPVPSLDAIASAAVAEAIAQVGDGKVNPAEVSLTIIDARDSHDPRIGAHLGNTRTFPASVVKLCYMVTAFDQIATGQIAMTEKLRGDLQTMIGVSSNVATSNILDLVTNTGFGPELPAEEFEAFAHKRRTVNRYMATLGLSSINACQKTFDAAVPFYGRDPQFLGPRAGDNYENSNMMTTDDTARLLYLIYRRAVVSRAACEHMLELMRRSEGRGTTVFSSIVPPGLQLYSKDGAVTMRGVSFLHDAGIFELPGQGSIIVVAFTRTRGADRPQPVAATAAALALERVGATTAIPGASTGNAQAQTTRAE